MKGSEKNPKKRGRGPAKGPEPTPEKKIIVDFNELMQPIGPQAIQFQSYLGTIARNGVKFPLTYPSWKDIPEENLENAWTEIQVK